MNSNMGTHPTVSNSDSFIGSNSSSKTSSSSRQRDGHEGMSVLSLLNQPHYSNYPQATMEYGHFNLYEKAGLAQPMTQEAGVMYDHHGNIYGNIHSSSHMTSDTNLSPPMPPRVYKPCVVCSDKSSGYHYGVSSCEGCKGFFRRSVQKSMQYICHKDKNCVINKMTRNRCQSCRLQKCIVVGMCKEAVRNDRNKRRKQKPESTSSHFEDLTEDDQTLLHDVLEAHRDSIHNAGEFVLSRMCESGAMAATSTQSSGSDKKCIGLSSPFLWEKILELSSAGIVSIVNFAKQIPGFLSLLISDQVTLLKAACLEIMILRISSRYDSLTDTLQFPNGLSLAQEQAEKEGLGCAAQNIFSFAASMKHINFDETEYALLSSICLISGDRSGLAEIEKIEQMQDSLLEALKRYVKSRRTDQKQMFAKVLVKLTDVRTITVRVEKKLSPHALESLPTLLSQPLPRASSSLSHNRVMSPQMSTPTGPHPLESLPTLLSHPLPRASSSLSHNRVMSPQMSTPTGPHPLESLPTLLSHPLPRASSSLSHNRVMSPQMSTPTGGRSETVTSATFRPYHIQGDMVPGSSPKPMSPLMPSLPAVSCSSIRIYNGSIFNGSNCVGNGSSGSTINSSSSLLLGTQPSMDGRNYSTSGLLGLDLEGVVLNDFTSNCNLNYQLVSSNTSSKATVNSISLSSYSNGRMHKQNSTLLNQWDIKQEEDTLSGASKNKQPSSETLEVIVKSVNQPFADQFGPTASFNRSPNSEAPSSGPLSSPSFLAGMHHHQYMSPSPDLGADLGMRMIYPPTQSVSTAGGLAYSSSMTMSAPPPYSYTMQSREQHLNQSGLLIHADHDFIQGLPTSSNSSTLTNVSNFLLVGSANQEIMSNIHQPSEGSRLDRHNADLVPSYCVDNNMHIQMISKSDNGNTSGAVWGSDMEGNLIYRPDVMMPLSHNGAHEIDGAQVSVAQPSLDTQNDITNMIVSSSRQDDESVDTRSSSISIGQLIGGALKVEPDHWIHYSDHE